MKLTEKQLKIQERADKTLSFGCIVSSIASHRSGRIIKVISHFDGNNIYYFVENNGNVDSLMKSVIKEIIGHPMTRGRLCYLFHINGCNNTFSKLSVSFKPDYLQQTVLERPEELQDLVIEFLECLQQG